MRMNPLKKLAGQTAIYGLSTILGRLLNYALVPFYTYIFSAPADYGVNTEFYAYISFLNIVFTYGMETAFFNFATKEENKGNVFTTAFRSLTASSLILAVPFIVFAWQIAAGLRLENQAMFVIWCILIVSTDAIAAIPFARLRQQNKAKKFAVMKLVNIFVNISLNAFFLGLCKNAYENDPGSMFAAFYNPAVGIGYAFVANLIANIVTLMLLVPEMKAETGVFDHALWKRMMVYALPLLIVGLAGMVNETLDRILIKYLQSPVVGEYMQGVYGACYKISILMTIFIQAFRYSAEPFFFSRLKDDDNKKVYARVMKYFVIACSLIFLFTAHNLSWIQYMIGETYRVGMPVVPVLLLANLFLGVYFNLSIWYKLTGRTMFGAWITLFGAVVTIALNFWWIPVYGFMGSAWATLICYAAMMVVSYILGQRYYPVKYALRPILTYLGIAVLLYVVSTFIHTGHIVVDVILKNALIVPYLLLLWKVEVPALRKK